jgi:transcriptional regulator
MSRSSGRASQGELLQGTLPLLILRMLAAGPNHGFAIARRIQQISKAVLRVEQGSLYPALHRLELDGVIESYWGTTENNRKAKYYRLTRRGARQLASDTKRWNSIAAAIAAVLQEG